MKIKPQKYSILAFLLLVFFEGFSQNTDSLSTILARPMADTTKVLLLDQIALNVLYSNPSLALKYAKDGLTLANQTNFLKGKSRILNRMGTIYRRTTNYANSLKVHLEALQISQTINDQEGICKIYNNLGLLFADQGDFQKSITYEKMAAEIAIKLNNNELLGSALNNTAAGFEKLNMLDSSKYYCQKAYSLEQNKIDSKNRYFILFYLGRIDLKQNKVDLAIEKLGESELYFKKNNYQGTLSEVYYNLALAFQLKNNRDSSEFFAKKSLQLATNTQNFQTIYNSAGLLSKLYEKENTQKAFEYYKQSVVAKDSIFNIEKSLQMQNVGIQEEIRKQELLESEKEFASRQKIGILTALLAGLFVVLMIQYRNNKQKQKANKLLTDQKLAIESQKTEIESSLKKLKTTQKQLIEQEKLASLGELTAGIAHEIQNPLNFVNNFSEINLELVEEILIETTKNEAERDMELEKELLNDLASNQSKILHHGQRASSIVKAMLEHSRNSNGQRNKVNINSIVEEFAKLSYLGIRTKYLDFTCDYILKLDENMPELQVVVQDIGRVILNLINNAFYAVKLKNELSEKAGQKFTPQVKIDTEYFPNKVLNDFQGYVQIKIADNGNGIPENIKEKIFQPFFTTKPTGEGTGLGLSISYDIITKAHHGALQIAGNEGEGAVFIIQIPIQ